MEAERLISSEVPACVWEAREGEELGTVTSFLGKGCFGDREEGYLEVFRGLCLNPR